MATSLVVNKPTQPTPPPPTRCHNEIGQCAQNTYIVWSSIIGDHLKRQRILTSSTHDFCTRTSIFETRIDTKFMSRGLQLDGSIWWLTSSVKLEVSKIGFCVSYVVRRVLQVRYDTIVDTSKSTYQLLTFGSNLLTVSRTVSSSQPLQIIHIVVFQVSK